MALFKNAKGRKDYKNSGYSRAFGNFLLGKVFSRAHATTISYGNELEKLIISSMKQVQDPDEFLSQNTIADGVYVITKKLVKQTKAFAGTKTEPDFLIFIHGDEDKHCYVVELKDGDNFDTKKSEGEYNSMVAFVEHISQKIPYKVNKWFVSFNQDDPNAVYAGFKKRVPPENCITGRMFCDRIKLNYDEIIQSRKKDVEQNFKDLLDAILDIPEARDFIENRINEDTEQ